MDPMTVLVLAIMMVAPVPRGCCPSRFSLDSLAVSSTL